MTRTWDFVHDPQHCQLETVEKKNVKKYYWVYCITNLVNNKLYFGETKQEPLVRWQQHVNLSRPTNKAPKSLIHRAIAKYGVDNFRFDIVFQTTRKAEMNAMEKRLIREHRADANVELYNVKAGGDHGEHSKETREKIGAAGRGRTKSTEAIERQAEARSREWIIAHPDGIIEVIKNLTQFCRVHGLNQANMISVANGTQNSCTGFRCARYSGDEFEIIEFKNRKFKTKSDKHSSRWKIIHPCGTRQTILNMKQFCSDNDLCNAKMSQVASGQRSHHKGFRCAKLS